MSKSTAVAVSPVYGIFVPPKVDMDQVKEIYTELSNLVYADMDKQYKEGKISGPTYSETWKELMKATIVGSLNSVVSLVNKETEADRCVKRSTCDKNKEEMRLLDLKTTKDMLLTDSKIVESKANVTLTNANKLLTDQKVLESKAQVTIAKDKSVAEIKLIGAKTKAEDIKNGTLPGVGSLYEQNILVLKAQDALYQRQKIGFDDNARQKVMDSALSSFSIMFQDLSIDATGLPEFLKTPSKMQQTYDDVAQKIGSTGAMT